MRTATPGKSTAAPAIAAALIAVALVAVGLAVVTVVSSSSSSVGGPAVPKRVRQCLRAAGLTPQFDNRFASLGFIGGFRMKSAPHGVLVLSVYSSDERATRELPRIRAIVAHGARGGAVRRRNVVISFEGGVARTVRLRAARCAMSS